MMSKITPAQVRLLQLLNRGNEVPSPWPTASLRALAERGLIVRSTLTLTKAGREVLAEIEAHQ